MLAVDVVVYLLVVVVVVGNLMLFVCSIEACRRCSQLVAVAIRSFVACCHCHWLVRL